VIFFSTFTFNNIIEKNMYIPSFNRLFFYDVIKLAAQKTLKEGINGNHIFF